MFKMAVVIQKIVLFNFSCFSSTDQSRTPGPDPGAILIHQQRREKPTTGLGLIQGHQLQPDHAPNPRVLLKSSHVLQNQKMQAIESDHQLTTTKDGTVFLILEKS